jgi:hypothetical protein
VAYNMRMNNPVGPKTCQVKETQYLRSESLGGKERSCLFFSSFVVLPGTRSLKDKNFMFLLFNSFYVRISVVDPNLHGSE